MSYLDQKSVLFAENFKQEILSKIEKSDISKDEYLKECEDKLTENAFEYIVGQEEIDNPIICNYSQRGIKINGYAISDNLDTLSLFVTIYNGQVPPINVTTIEINNNFKRLLNFFKKSINGYDYKFDELSPASDLYNYINDLKDDIDKIKLFLITDGISGIDTMEDNRDGEFTITYHIWDIQKIYRSHTSGNKRDTIEINFMEKFGTGIRCLPMPETTPPNNEYMTYLCIVPAKMLVNLYATYGSKLLERNVRSFLSVRGKVNKGIRKTIITEPYMFLAYNNGISTIADSVDINIIENNMYIINVKEFQIVNGGQTTASLYNASKKDKADLSQILVPVKLTVLSNNSKMDSIVPKISEYANSQNKINSADFSANDLFHITIEGYSRSIWAPAQKGSQKETHWYYERARGQYLDEKSRCRTTTEKKQFDAENPAIQKFTKTDLAKYENSWRLLPYKVSLGAEKNFNEFTVKLKDDEKVSGKKFDPDQKYFEDLISKAILLKETEKLVSQQKYGGYRANIVTYTIAVW